MKTRDEIITGMCYTHRHDYGLDRSENDPPWTAGMTPLEREGLRRTMTQIFDNCIAPYMKMTDEEL